MNNLLPVLLALLVGAAAMFLLGGDDQAPEPDTDSQLVSALAELRQEVRQLREQMAQRPQLVTSTQPYSTPNGVHPPLREPDDQMPPPPPPRPDASPYPELAAVQYIRRDIAGGSFPTKRSEKETEVLRTFHSGHDDEEAHKRTLRDWIFVSEREFVRRFTLPDEVRVQDGHEVWVYENLDDEGLTVHLRFHNGRFLGVY